MKMYDAIDGQIRIVVYPETLENADYDSSAEGNTEPVVAAVDQQVLDVPHDEAKSIAGMAMLRNMFELGNITQEGYFDIAHKFEMLGGEGHAEIVVSQNRIKTDQEYIEQGVEIRQSRQLSPCTSEILDTYRKLQAGIQPEQRVTAISTDVKICKTQESAKNPPELNALLAMALKQKELGPDEKGYFSKFIPEGRDKEILWCKEAGRLADGSFALCVCLHRDGTIAVDSFFATAPNTFAGVTPARESVAYGEDRI
jgi:hypothetical protein